VTPKSTGCSAWRKTNFHDLEPGRIATIYPIESKLLKRLDGGISLGFSLRASTKVTQLNLTSNVKYRQERTT